MLRLFGFIVLCLLFLLPAPKSVTGQDLPSELLERIHSTPRPAEIPCNCCTCDELTNAMVGRWTEAMAAFGICEQFNVYDSMIAPGAVLIPNGAYAFSFPIKFSEAFWASFSCNETRREFNQINWVVGDCEHHLIHASITTHYVNVTNPLMTQCRNITGTGYMYRYAPCDFLELRFETAPGGITNFFPC